MSATKILSTICAASALALMAGAASAASITVASVVGEWVGHTGGQNVTTMDSGENRAELRWGNKAPGVQSGYDFLGMMPPPKDLEENVPIMVGEFSHLNYTIPTGTSITQAILEVTFGFWLDTDDQDSDPMRTLISTFVFDHWETDNDPGNNKKCANGEANNQGINKNGCADRVTAKTNKSKTETITIGNVEYAFSVTGFMVGDEAMTQFWTKEGEKNTASLQAKFTSAINIAPVPLPAGGLLLLGGLGALGVMRRRRKAA